MRILLVQDDLDYLSDHIAEIEKEYIVDIAYTTSDGCFMSEVNDYDTIVVDGCLKSGNSRFFCKDVRNSNISSPILYLSDQIDSVERASCLQDGANVCMPRNSTVQELSAQIKALTRLRYKSVCSSVISLFDGVIVVDLSLRQVRILNVEVSLRRKEFGILEQLLLNRGHVVSKEELLDHIWDDGILVKSNSLEVHVRNLRCKLERPLGIALIKTARGYGYRID